MRLLVDRDQAGVRRLLEDHAPRVNWCLRKEFRASLGEAEFDEAISLAAHRAWRSAATYDSGKGALGTWFYTIARNATLLILQRELRQRRVRRVADWDLVGFLTPSVQDYQPSRRQRRFLENLQVCIEKLPPLQMSIIKADLAAGGLANAGELAKRHQTTKNSVYASRSIARKTLKRALIAMGHSNGDPAEERSRAE